MNYAEICPNNLKQHNHALLAAIESQNNDSTERVVDSVVAKLKDRNFTIIGLRQRVSDTSSNRCAAQLQCIETGTYHRMTQELGTGSTSCNIDSEALDRLAELKKNEIQPGVDLVFVNRFGKREARGSGFCSVFEKAVSLGIPVLTIVSPMYLAQWSIYGEELVTTLPPEEADILLWIESVAETYSVKLG